MYLYIAGVVMLYMAFDCIFLSWQIILDAGVDVNLRNVHNTIPLHVALARGAKSCVGLLLSAGANCNLQVSQLYIYHTMLYY